MIKSVISKMAKKYPAFDIETFVVYYIGELSFLYIDTYGLPKDIVEETIREILDGKLCGDFVIEYSFFLKEHNIWIHK